MWRTHTHRLSHYAQHIIHTKPEYVSKASTIAIREKHTGKKHPIPTHNRYTGNLHTQPYREYRYISIFIYIPYFDKMKQAIKKDTPHTMILYLYYSHTFTKYDMWRENKELKMRFS